MELRSWGFGDGGFEGELGGEFGKGGGIGSEKFEAEELAAGGGVGGGVNEAGGHFFVGVCKYKPRTPLNEEREKAVGVVFQVERLPAEFFAVGAFARTGSRAFGNDGLLFELGGVTFDVVAKVRGPTNEARFGEVLEFVEQRRGAAGLLRIGRDDFEIAAEALCC